MGGRALILPRRKLLLAAPALILPHRRALAFEPHPLYSAHATSPLMASVGTAMLNTTTSAAIDTRGATLIVVYGLQYAGVAKGTLTDSNSNTWAQPFTETDAAAVTQVNTYTCFNPTTSASHTFTMTRTGYNGNFVVMAFRKATSATENTGHVDQVGLGNTALTQGSVTPSVPNCIITAGLCVNGVNAADSYAVGGGMKVVYTNNAIHNVANGGIAGWFQQSAASAVALPWTWTGAESASAIMMAFPATG